MSLASTGERTVTVTVRVKREGKWTRLPAAYGRNGRIRPGFAQAGKQQVKFDPIVYEVRFYEGRQAKYKTGGRNAQDAETERMRLETEFKARAHAQNAGLKIEAKPEERKTLRQSGQDYVDDCEARGAGEAAVKSGRVTEEFIQVTKRQFWDEITRQDVLKFHTAMRKRGCSDRTIANAHDRLKSWMIFAGIDHDEILPPAPRYEKKLPTVYTRDDISSIMGAADDKQRLTYSLALKCGLREQELAHVEYYDFDFDHGVLRVRSKPRYDFRVKDSEERDIPVPRGLLKEIKARRAAHPNDRLVLPTVKGKPDTKMLRTLKRLAKRDGLNCGHCKGCASDLQECGYWTLHRFRRSYLTTLLRNRVDIRTAQAFAGHADLASTMRYLAPASADETRAAIEAIKWG